MGSATDALMMGFTTGEAKPVEEMKKRDTDRQQREQEGSLLMRGMGVEYPIDRTSKLRGTASATLSGGFKVRGVKIEYKRTF